MSTPPSHRITSDNHGPTITVVAALLAAWMLCVYLTRVIIRLRFTPWGWDDNIMTFGTAVAIAQVVAVCRSVHYGLGKKIDLVEPSDLDMVEKLLYCSQILYIVVLGASKTATAVLILRLTRTKSHRLATNIVIAITAAWSVASIFVIAFRGDVTHPWTSWDQPGAGVFPRWIAIEVIGMLIELAIVSLSVTLVSFLQMKLTLKIMVVGAFFTRVLVIAPAILRLYYIRPSFNAPDPTFNNVTAVILTQVAMHYGLIAASIPCLKPFIRPFDTGYVGDTGDGYANLSTANAMFPTRSRSVAQGTNMILNSVTSNDSRLRIQGKGKGREVDVEKDGIEPTSDKRACRFETWTSRGVRLHTHGGHPLSPDMGEMVTVVEHSPLPSRRAEMIHSMMEDGDMVIRQTREYEVHFEKVDDSV